MTHLNCPNCSSNLDLPNDPANGRVQCPNCRQVVPVQPRPAVQGAGQGPAAVSPHTVHEEKSLGRLPATGVAAHQMDTATLATELPKQGTLDGTTISPPASAVGTRFWPRPRDPTNRDGWAATAC